MTHILNKKYIVKMSDGSRWAVPVEIIAVNRAEEYCKEFGNSIQRSLREDTIPLFEADHWECADWAKNNMNWDDVHNYARQVSSPSDDVDFQDGWVNGEWEIE